MDVKIVLDISSVVWDKNDFFDNQSFYYCLASEFVIFLQAFEKCSNLKFVARNELLNNIREQFPYSIPNSAQLFTFKKRALQFLSNNRTISYIADNNSMTRSVPDICYNYFIDTLKIEVQYLISEMHRSGNYIFCTFSSRWNTTDNLKTVNSTTKEHNTVIHGVGKQTIQDFYNTTFRNIFEHNSKHDKLKGKRKERGVWVFPLSCFDGNDVTIPQNLLDNAVKKDNEFYNYDTVNQTFVCFKCHSDNKYHGYDEDINNVPQKIRDKFYK
ncbi:MAG: hypothetical protein LBP63_04320 [Prevotellaceae bacterium]|jgi:hypothetical protein|nr:hypothetical protein [Prevotellaceae bacterium]